MRHTVSTINGILETQIHYFMAIFGAGSVFKLYERPFAIMVYLHPLIVDRQINALNYFLQSTYHRLTSRLLHFIVGMISRSKLILSLYKRPESYSKSGSITQKHCAHYSLIRTCNKEK